MFNSANVCLEFGRNVHLKQMLVPEPQLSGTRTEGAVIDAFPEPRIGQSSAEWESLTVAPPFQEMREGFWV